MPAVMSSVPRGSIAYGAVRRVFNLARRRFAAAAPVLVAPAAALAVALTPVSGPGAAAGERGLPLVVAFGDSLTAGLGLAPAETFPARLAAWLESLGTPARVVNAGLSGDTTAGGRARLSWTLAAEPEHPPDLVIVELGANDALRGIAPAVTRTNLEAILATLGERGIPVLLAGMRAPPNLGDAYGTAFDAIYPELAAKYGVALYPFFLEGVAAEPSLNQPDGMHPNAAGADLIARRLAPHVRRLLDGGG